MAVKIKVKKEVTTTEEKEVDVPPYFKDPVSPFFYRLVTEKYAICVSVLAEWGTSIAMNRLDVAASRGIVPITEEEYNEKFEEATTILTLSPKQFKKQYGN